MATILFQAAGAGLGGLLGPVGAIVGRAAGALIGNAVDRALIGGTRTVSGARLATARIPGASEGTAVPRVYGTMRVGGTLIWATRFEEVVSVERAGAKATGGTRVESFRYYANFALALCEGPIAGIRRVWADGREIDQTAIEMRLHRGTGYQLPDPLIEAKQGTGNAPAYRGLAYVVFERLPLEAYGNRIPVLQFEVIRTVGDLEGRVRAITMIPGATEHGYATDVTTETTGAGSARNINRNTLTAATDWHAAMDELQAVCPNLQHVALVVAWFGTDLRAGDCRIRPGVEVPYRGDESKPWRVAGIDRGLAHEVSWHEGGPAYGGTPDDASVVQAIADLRARGLKVTLYPFVMMDIPPGNGLQDPYGGAEQAAYPWRGRITCHPAPGRPGTADRTAAVTAQVTAFTGSAEPSDFTVDGREVQYAGADEGYRRMVLHYAHLAKAAGGVDAFLIGSELRGLTTLRDAADGFPFVAALGQLAGEVRTILGAGSKISYGADWSEYFGYQPADGSGHVYFHLDPLWANPAIDAVGIDNYMPLSDWRDSDLDQANPDGFRLADDRQAMRNQIAGGEGYDWFYASAADREARSRTPISDGAAGKPWVFRYKDIVAWWGNPHIERRNGVELAAPTAWTPGMKPIWFTELGCPAVDKGAGQPNVFPDRKSSENALPHFSSGQRSASQQRRFLDAHLDHWLATPGGMVDPERIYLWSFDARPYPAFPANRALWSDGGNWATGHWLNGRLGAGTLADVIAAILRDHGFDDYDVSQVTGDLDGYVQAEVTSARALIEPLMAAFRLDAVEQGGRIVFRSRDRTSMPPRALDVLADIEGEPLWRETRGHDSDFADEAVLTFADAAMDYEEASVRSRKLADGSNRVLALNLSACLDEETALDAAEAMLRDHRIGRRQLECSVSPSLLELEPGDVLSLPGGPQGRFQVTRIEHGEAIRLHMREIGSSRTAPAAAEGEGRAVQNPAGGAFSPHLVFLDLPRVDGEASEGFARVAGLVRPWRRIALSSSVSGEAYRARVTLDRPATMGRLTAPLAAGPSGVMDLANAVQVQLFFGELSSVGQLELFEGANRIAVRSSSGALEIIGFSTAEEIGPGHWRLTGLLRALHGTEDAMRAGAGTGADLVLLDSAVRSLGLSSDEAGRPLRWLAERIGGAAPPVGPVEFAGGLRAETPLSPVHLRGIRRSDGAVVLSWIRRGRVDADDWDATDIPLEEPEAYRLDILKDGAAVRTVETDQTAHVYPAADEAADFGSAQTSLAVRVRQKGRKVPLGMPLEAIINL